MSTERLKNTINLKNLKNLNTGLALDLFESDIDDIDDDTEYLETKNTLILRTSKTLDWNNVRPPLSFKM